MPLTRDSSRDIRSLSTLHLEHRRARYNLIIFNIFILNQCENSPTKCENFSFAISVSVTVGLIVKLPAAFIWPVHPPPHYRIWAQPSCQGCIHLGSRNGSTVQCKYLARVAGECDLSACRIIVWRRWWWEDVPIRKLSIQHQSVMI